MWLSLERDWNEQKGREGVFTRLIAGKLTKVCLKPFILVLFTKNYD